MLESDAKTKLCPFKMAGGAVTFNGFLCDGSDCMGWDEWKKLKRQSRKPDGAPDYKAPRRYMPRDPAEGDCGMKSQELECSGG